MAQRKHLPVLTERSLGQMKAERLDIASQIDAKLPKVSCKAGCAACCSYPLYISILEGMLLYRQLTAKGHWTPSFRKKLEAHAEQTFDLPAQVWLMLDIACPVLDKTTKKCMAYDARPFTCRSLYAMSDPQFCRPAATSDARFVNRDDATADFRLAESRILSRHKLSLLGMPLSRAILLGEKIVTGEADLEHYLALALADLRKKEAAAL